MNKVLTFLRSEATKLSGHLLWAVKHPSTARKASAATLVHVLALVAAFGYFFPNLSTEHAAIFTAITGGITWLSTFLASNVVVQVANDIEEAEA